MNQKIKLILMISFILSLIVFPKIAFSSNNIYDSFNYSNTALAQTAINEEKIELRPYENEGNSINRHANGWSVRWVVTSSIASLSLVTGLTPRELQSLPICAIGILIMAYLVASKLTKDWRIAVLYTVIIAFDPSVNSLTNGTYIQGWGFIFYFMFIYALLTMAERQDYLALAGERERYKTFLFYVFLISCSLIMMYYTYYSTLIYAVIMIFVVAGGLLFNTSGKALSKRHIALFLAFLAIAFTTLYHAEPTVRFALYNFQGLLGTSFNYATDVVHAGGSRFYVGLLSYILIFTPLCLLGYKWIRASIGNRKLPLMKHEDIFISAFLFTGLVNVVVYAGLGLVDLKYFIIIFTLSALYAVKRLRVADLGIGGISLGSLPLRRAFALALTLVFVLKFVTFVAPIMADDSNCENEGVRWLSDNCIYPDVDSISDLAMSGNIMLLHTERGHTEFNSFIYSANYLQSLSSGSDSEMLRVSGNISIIVMNERNMNGHFNIGNWETWEIEESPADIIDRYASVQRIYSSGGFSVWRIYR